MDSRRPTAYSRATVTHPLPPPPPGHYINATQDQIKQAQEAQKQWREAEKVRIKQKAERRKREIEAAQRVRDSRTSQR